MELEHLPPHVEVVAVLHTLVAFTCDFPVSRVGAESSPSAGTETTTFTHTFVVIVCDLCGRDPMSSGGEDQLIPGPFASEITRVH